MQPQPYAVEANRLLRDYGGVRLSFHRDSRPRPSCTTSFGGRRARRAPAAPFGPDRPLCPVAERAHRPARQEPRGAPQSRACFEHPDALPDRARRPRPHRLRERALERAALLSEVIVAILLASVILVVVDLDRPRRGLITIGVQPLIDLETSIGAPKGASDTQ
jgi:hypothetical protein